MLTISEIQEAILSLREHEFAELKKWLSALEAERRWKAWDEQIEADSDAGKLDFLVAEALEAKANGTLCRVERSLRKESLYDDGIPRRSHRHT